MNMEGIDNELALAMAAIGVKSMEDLAEQAIDDLMGIVGMDEERAGKLIMTARAPGLQVQQHRIDDFTAHYLETRRPDGS